MKTRARTDTRGPGRHALRRHRRHLQPTPAHTRAANLFPAQTTVGPDDETGPGPDAGGGHRGPGPGGGSGPGRGPGSGPRGGPALDPDSGPVLSGPGSPAPVRPSWAAPDGDPADSAVTAAPAPPPQAPLRQLFGWLRGRCGGVEPRTLAALCVVLVIALGFAVHHYLSGRPQSVTAERTAPAARAASLEPAPAPSAGAPPHPPPAGTVGSGAIGGQRLVIDIAGEVAEPGVRTMPPGSRVTDAIEAAGGVAPGTETEGINRARLLIDGEHLLIGGEQPGPPPGPGAAPGRGTGAVLADGRVGINAATVQELEQLPGVGPVLAGNIASYRDQQGGFTAVEQLLSVPGIGPARLSQLRDRVVL